MGCTAEWCSCCFCCFHYGTCCDDEQLIRLPIRNKFEFATSYGLTTANLSVNCHLLFSDVPTEGAKNTHCFRATFKLHIRMFLYSLVFWRMQPHMCGQSNST